MKSIKRGRGPSMMEGMSGIFVAVFGVIWTLAALSMGAPFFFVLFGVVFVVMAIVRTIYSFKNATSEDRYSLYEIVDESEESDPFNERYGRTAEGMPDELVYGSIEDSKSAERIYCPYCGAALQDDFEFCMKCGSKLPD